MCFIRSITRAAFSAAAVLVLSAIVPAESMAQTIAEVLGTPGVVWTPAGDVTAITQPDQAHDGKDCLRINPRGNNTAAGIQTELIALSVVDGYYRSEDLSNYTTFSVGQQKFTASSWKALHLLASPGPLVMHNLGTPARGALYLDEVQIRPAVVVPVADALDFPAGLISFPPTPNLRPFAEPDFAPDGADAAVLSGPVEFSANLAGPRVLQYRVSHPQGGAASVVKNFYQMTDGNHVWVPLPAGRAAGIIDLTEYAGPSLILDQMNLLPVLEVAEALGAPSLSFTANGRAVATMGPDVAPAVLLMPGSVADRGAVTTTIPGPCLLKFSYRGSISVATPTLPETFYQSPSYYPSPQWASMEIPLFKTENTVTWRVYANGTGAWLKAITIAPRPDTSLLGEWLGQPGYEPALLPGVFVSGSTSSENPYLYYRSANEGLLPLLQLPVTGPMLVSLRVNSPSSSARFRVDGGSWHSVGGFSPDYYWGQYHKYIVPLAPAGMHTFEAGGLGILSSLEFTPLQVIPLPEALDAPELTFTTSPDLPWTGYATPVSLGFRGGQAVCGGQHVTAGDPWLETTVTGPGTISFSTFLAASNPPLTAAQPSLPPVVLLDGMPYVTKAGPVEIPLSPGPHTIRWVQPGSQVLTGTGSLWWLDAVTFTPVTGPLPGDCDPGATTDSVSENISTILQTPGRTWRTLAPDGDPLACAWSARIQEGLESVPRIIPYPSSMLGASTDPPFRLQTTVQLPCVITLSGENLEVIDPATGKSLSRIGSYLYYPDSVSVAIPGHGAATLILQPWVWGKKSALHTIAIKESSDRIRPDYFSAQDPIPWSKTDGSAWHLYQTAPFSEPWYRLKPGEWLETTVEGPCWIPSGKNPFDVMILPDQGSRYAIGSAIHFPGPQRILARVSAPESRLFLQNSLFEPGLPLADGTASPKLAWSTGGDVPCAVFQQGTVSVPYLRPGEKTWMEAILPGPGILSWLVQKPYNNYNLGPKYQQIAMLIDQKHIDTLAGNSDRPLDRPYLLHIGPGLHTFRWESSLPVDGPANPYHYANVTITNIVYRQQERGIVESLGDHGISLVGKPADAYFYSPYHPFPDFLNWTTFPDFHPAGSIRSPSESLFLAPVTAGPGVLSMDIRMAQQGAYLGSPSYYPLPLSTYPANGNPFDYHPPAPPAFAAPFPWQRWTTADRFSPFPLRGGCTTYLADAVFIPDAPTSIGEALDQPALPWTTGGSRPGLWTALTGPGSRHADPGGLYLAPMLMGEKAWVETTVTGPATVSTQFMEYAAHASLAMEVDGISISPTAQTPDLLTISIPAGPHRLRWTAAPKEPIHQNQPYGIRSIRISSPSYAFPAVAELLDSPGLTWAASDPAILSQSALSHDGVDALRISSSGSPPGEFKVLLTGPGVASWWSSSSSSGMDDTSFTLPGYVAVGPWKRYLLPIPSGDHVVRFPVPSVGYMDVDEFRFDPSVTLSVADALDLPPGTGPIVSNPSGIGASTWPGLTDQPSDALLLMPGYANQLRVQVPFGSTLAVRVKGLADSSLFSFANIASLPAPSSSWRTITFLASNSVMIPLTAGSAPVLLDQLTITPATPLEQYFPWVADQGLTGAQQDPGSDPDKDGFNNALEYALNSNPLENSHIPYATATSPGLPVINLSKNASTQVATISVTYWKRSHQKAILETAVDPGGTLSTAHPFGWEPSPKAGTATSPGLAGWERIIWQSTAGSVPGERMSFRVRYEIP